MLDLKLLEKQLDEVLEQETSETMTSWLLVRRLKKYVNTLGEGSFISTLTSNLGNVTGTLNIPPQFFRGEIKQVTEEDFNQNISE